MWYYEERLQLLYIRHLRTICKHTSEIPKKFDLRVYRFYNMAAKLTFTMESSQLYLQRPQTAKGPHELIIITMLLSSSPKLKRNQKTGGPFNTRVQCTLHTERNKHNRRKHRTQKVSTEKLPVSKQKWGCCHKPDSEQHLWNPVWPAFLPQKCYFH